MPIYSVPSGNVRVFSAQTQPLSWFCKQALTKTSHPLIVTLMRNTFPVAPQRLRSNGWRQLWLVLMCAWVWVFVWACVYVSSMYCLCVCLYVSLLSAFIFIAVLCTCMHCVVYLHLCWSISSLFLVSSPLLSKPSGLQNSCYSKHTHPTYTYNSASYCVSHQFCRSKWSEIHLIAFFIKSFFFFRFR